MMTIVGRCEGGDNDDDIRWGASQYNSQRRSFANCLFPPFQSSSVFKSLEDTSFQRIIHLYSTLYVGTNMEIYTTVTSSSSVCTGQTQLPHVVSSTS